MGTIFTPFFHADGEKPSLLAFPQQRHLLLVHLAGAFPVDRGVVRDVELFADLLYRLGVALLPIDYALCFHPLNVAPAISTKLNISFARS